MWKDCYREFLSYCREKTVFFCFGLFFLVLWLLSLRILCFSDCYPHAVAEKLCGSCGWLLFFLMLIIWKVLQFEPKFGTEQVQSGILQGRMEIKRKAQGWCVLKSAVLLWNCTEKRAVLYGSWALNTILALPAVIVKDSRCLFEHI